MFPRKRTIVPLLVLFLGIIFILISIILGEADIAILFIIPVIYGSGPYLTTGILLIIISFILFFISSAIGLNTHVNSQKEMVVYDGKRSKRKYGGVIFIGPIPIIFGGNESIGKKMMYIGLAIAVILLVLYLMIIYG